MVVVVVVVVITAEKDVMSCGSAAQVLYRHPNAYRSASKCCSQTNFPRPTIGGGSIFYFHGGSCLRHVPARELDREDLESPHEGGEARERRLAAAADADEHGVAARLAEHARDAGYVLHGVREEHCAGGYSCWGKGLFEWGK